MRKIVKIFFIKNKRAHHTPHSNAHTIKQLAENIHAFLWREHTHTLYERILFLTLNSLIFLFLIEILKYL